ncbi:NAD-dependent epimerase/dehydratase family protein [Blastochloris sulfoviridis]|uniref:NAD-dependent epimerase/dehydratase family protein n=1 Tax=Blastochloris sulfoviridis TaxID=50712 RepID=A0A5M6I5W7_9HYPH|nr:NAD-dependent epimerase/dehydratase family protein [Blastochloris sulfoviridis]KAA5603523.1 NAD-dependent epimerase/dehydratase family protein [Blastochloris sulfoviridis]
MRRALVTGGRGFIGRHLVRSLRGLGCRVATVGRSPASDPSDIVLDEASWTPSALGDIIEREAPDWIFHLAGSATGTREQLDRANVRTTLALLEGLARTARTPLLVCAGSAAEYGAAIRDGEPVAETLACAPVSDYGISKHAQSCAALRFAEETGHRVIVARVFNPIGADMPAHLALGSFARQIAASSDRSCCLRVGNLNVQRDMIDVEHAAKILIDLAFTENARGVVNVCSGQAPLLRDLVDCMISSSGRNVSLEVDPARVRPGEIRTIVGSTARLAEFGCLPPPTDFPAVVARIWEAVVDSTGSPN